MLFAVVVASLVAILAGSLVFLGQLLWQARGGQGEDQDLRALLAERGSLTPLEAAQSLGIPVVAADRRLRRLVDDRRVRMEIDLGIGALRFLPVGRASAVRSPLTPAQGGAPLLGPPVPRRRPESTAR